MSELTLKLQSAAFLLTQLDRRMTAATQNPHSSPEKCWQLSLILRQPENGQLSCEKGRERRGFDKTLKWPFPEHTCTFTRPPQTSTFPKVHAEVSLAFQGSVWLARVRLQHTRSSHTHTHTQLTFLSIYHLADTSMSMSNESSHLLIF